MKRKSTLYSTDIIVNGVFNGGDEGAISPDRCRTPELPFKDMKLLNNFLASTSGWIRLKVKSGTNWEKVQVSICTYNKQYQQGKDL